MEPTPAEWIFAPDWPAPARAIVERGIERYGGWKTWRALRSVSFSVRALTGMVPWLKGVGKGYPMARRIEVFPREARARFPDYPTDGQALEFERGAIRIVAEDAAGTVLLDDRDRRAKFRGLTRLRRWDAADTGYFFGYALTYYNALPFLLARTGFVAWRAAAWKGCDAVTVDFPDDVVTHCRRQSFFFDASGLITRHDYRVDIIGAIAQGCHLWLDYDESSPFPVPRRRQVMAKLFGGPTPILALLGELGDVAVTLAPEVRAGAGGS